MKSFRITDGKGFQIKFDNGWVVSVQFGPGNYGDNYNAEFTSDAYQKAGEQGSDQAECAIFHEDTSKWHQIEDGCDVVGYKNAQEVLDIINIAANLAPRPAHTSHAPNAVDERPESV